MEKITREYAIIYIDRKGETLNQTEQPYKGDYVTKELIHDYYNSPGFLQWNYYLIIPKELVKPEEMSVIENNDVYTRKYVIESDKIDQFINDRFPVLKKEKGTIKLIKGNSWVESSKLSKEEQQKNDVSLYPSWYRNECLMYSLTEMDILRAKLINNPEYKALFFSHISNEFNIAEKKFKLFQNEESELL